jgi:hypothetical protein
MLEVLVSTMPMYVPGKYSYTILNSWVARFALSASAIHCSEGEGIATGTGMGMGTTPHNHAVLYGTDARFS